MALLDLWWRDGPLITTIQGFLREGAPPTNPVLSVNILSSPSALEILQDLELQAAADLQGEQLQNSRSLHINLRGRYPFRQKN